MQECEVRKLKSSEFGFVTAGTFKYMQVNVIFSILAFPLKEFHGNVSVLTKHFKEAMISILRRNSVGLT